MEPILIRAGREGGLCRLYPLNLPRGGQASGLSRKQLWLRKYVTTVVNYIIFADGGVVRVLAIGHKDSDATKESPDSLRGVIYFRLSRAISKARNFSQPSILKEPGGRGPFPLHHERPSAFYYQCSSSSKTARPWETLPWSLIFKIQGAGISRKSSQ